MALDAAPSGGNEPMAADAPVEAAAGNVGAAAAIDADEDGDGDSDIVREADDDDDDDDDDDNARRHHYAPGYNAADDVAMFINSLAAANGAKASRGGASAYGGQREFVNQCRRQLENTDSIPTHMWRKRYAARVCVLD